MPAAARAIENCPSIKASHRPISTAAFAISRSCSAARPCLSAAIAAGTVRVLSCNRIPRLEASSSNSFLSEGMLGSKVTSSATSVPTARASSSIASLGFNTGTRTAGTTQTFTEDLLKDALQQMYTSGGDVDGAVLMVDPTQKTIASTFAGIATPFKNVGSGQATIVGAVDVYVSDFGEISIVPNRFQRSLDAWVLDFALIRLRDLRPYQVKDLAKTGDATKKYMVTETTLQVDNEAGLALITDLV